MGIDEDRFAAAGLVFERLYNVATFYTPDRPDPVEVVIVDDQLIFVPDRSAGQRRVLSFLAE